MNRIIRFARGAILAAALLSPTATLAEGVSFQGMWKNAAPRASLKPDDGAIPFTAQGKARYEEYQGYKAKRQYVEYDYTISRCAAPGATRVMLTDKRFAIFQRADLMVVAFEWNRYRRFVTLPGLAPQQALFGPGENLAGTAMGESRGRWEGDTLVVTTEKFDESTLIDDLVPHGYGLKVTERIRLKDADTLEDRITVEDPEFFTRPWEATLTYKRQPDALLPEDICLDRLQGPPPLPTN